MAFDFFKKLNINQKVGFIAIFLIIIITLVFTLKWLRRPSFALLYSNLTPEDAGEIIDKLKDMGIPYKLSAGGTSIRVPEEQVYETRLQLASEGIPKSSLVGYEIFDKTQLGATEFVQKINYHRAIEGELTRTIEALEGIQKARVHLVIPEKRLFEEDQKEPTASITLTLQRGAGLTQKQIKGIASLVASSVEGLNPLNITIIDSYGNILFGGKREAPEAIIASNRFELKQNVERYLENKVETMLAGVVGPTNVIARVNVELDFQNIEKSKEIYDPESPVIRSEERHKSTNEDKSESSITNYEISKTVEHIIDISGNIKKLFCSVFVNGTYEIVEEEGKKVTKYTPRTDEELAEFTAIVKNAIGFDEKRGDKIKISCVAFGAPEIPVPVKPSLMKVLMPILQKVLILAIIGAVFFFGLKIAKQFKEAAEKRVVPPTPAPEVPPVAPPVETDFEKLQAEIRRIATEKPDEIASAITSWLETGPSGEE